MICNLGVVGSNPTRGSERIESNFGSFLFYDSLIFFVPYAFSRVCLGGVNKRKSQHLLRLCGQSFNLTILGNSYFNVKTNIFSYLFISCFRSDC